MLARPEVDVALTTVGASQNACTGSAPERTRINVQLVPKSQRANLYELTALFREDLARRLVDRPEAKVRVKGLYRRTADGGRPRVRPQRARPRDARRGGPQARRVLLGLPFVLDVRSSLSERTREFAFRLDPAKLAGTGLNALDVGRALRTYLTGSEAGEVKGASGAGTPIVVRADPRFLGNLPMLESLPIAAPAQRAVVPLAALGTFAQREAPAASGEPTSRTRRGSS